uniref:C2H2-type domain-containing protein n=1 Tax=Steinernema glaseri TaxID=37863 RepID=A0A1I7Y6H9_9BILA
MPSKSWSEHIYMHLAKYKQIYRFKCDFTHCTYETYRKDTLQRHMNHVHDGVCENKIRDRKDQLAKAYEDMIKEITA